MCACACGLGLACTTYINISPFPSLAPRRSISLPSSFFHFTFNRLISSFDMLGQSNIRGRGRGRPRKTPEEVAPSQQRRRADKNAREAFRYNQAQEQRRRRRQWRQMDAIQGPEGEGEGNEGEEMGGVGIAPLAPTSGNNIRSPISFSFCV